MLEGDYAENCYAINPVTNEKIKIIKGNKNQFIIPLHDKEDYELSLKYDLPRKLAVIPYFTGEEIIFYLEKLSYFPQSQLSSPFLSHLSWPSALSCPPPPLPPLPSFIFSP